MSTAPCKDCPRKGCGVYHSKCDKYLAFQKECEAERKHRYYENELMAYKRDCIKPRKRRKLNESEFS